MQRIQFPASVRGEIARHLRAQYPREGCGVLLGHGGRISDAVPVANIAPPGNNDRFEFDPLDYSEGERRANAAGLRIVGFFHSHPDSPPVPSRVDLEAAQGLFEFARERYLYAIQTVTASGAGELRIWRLSEKNDGFIDILWD